MKSVMNIEEIERIVEKMNMYKRLEDVSLSSIQQTLNTLLEFYHTNNTENLKNISVELSRKYKTINTVHTSDIEVLRKNINTYLTLSKKTSATFNNLDVL